MSISLPIYDLVAKQWLPIHCKSTYRNTMLGHLFPDVEFAIGDVGSLLVEENVDESTIASILDDAFEDYILVGGSGSRKEGKAIYAKSKYGADIFTRFFGSSMNASNYGSNLTTECKVIKDISIKLLVVEDGDAKSRKYRTGDCHGKCSEKFAMEFANSIYNPFQFRAFNRNPDWCAKGTVAVGWKRGKYDLVLPTSSFKGNKVEPGEYELSNLAFGLVFKSPAKKSKLVEVEETETEIIERYAQGWDFRKSNLSYSVLQFLPWDAVEKDILPIARRQCQELNSLFNNPQKLLEYLLCKDNGNSDDGVLDGSKLSQILKADVHGQLSTHPWTVKATSRLLAARWREIATSGGMKFNSSMVMPDEELPDNYCYIPGLADGEEVIVFPYPCRWKYDIKVWTNKVLPQWEQQEGVIVGNQNTLLKLGRDTDGDFLMWLPSARLPHVAEAVKCFGEPSLDQAGLKPKKIPLQGSLGEVLVKSMKNLTGLITYYIAKSWACKREDFVQELVPQLQAAVDSLKGATPPDERLLNSIGNALKFQRVEWLRQVKDNECYLYYPMPPRANDTIGLLIANVNQLWVRPEFKATNLRAFQPLFSHYNPNALWVKRAEERAKEYGNAMYSAGEEIRKWKVDNPNKKVPRLLAERALSRRKSIMEYYEGILSHLPLEQKRAAVAAFWMARHKANMTGIPDPTSKDEEKRKGFSTNVCFLVGTDIICNELQTLRMNSVPLIGRQYSDFRDHIFKGECVSIKIESGLGSDGKHYFLARSNGYTLGAVEIRRCPPIKVEEGEFNAFLHTRFDKVGHPSYNEAIIIP